MIVNYISLLGQHVMWLMGSVSRIVRIMDQLHVEAEVVEEAEVVAVDIVGMVFSNPMQEKSVM